MNEGECIICGNKYLYVGLDILERCVSCIDLKKSIDSFKRDYTDGYVSGYYACLDDIEDKIKDKVDLILK